MKKILFVVPSLEVGGTISSLSSIIQVLKDRYEISVFPLAYEGNLNVDFKDILLPKKILTHAYICNYKNTQGLIRILFFIIKILKRVLGLLNIDFEQIIYKSVSTSFSDKYDVAIGFQEGSATKFVSLIQAKTKIAWVHCDYTKYYGCGNELWTYDKFNKIVCVSKYTADSFITSYPTLSKKVSYIHNFMNYDKIISCANLEIEDSRFLRNQFTILSVGRINVVKRFDKIPSIARFLVDKGCKFRWYIIGPNFADDVYKSLLNSIVSESVEEYVCYLGNKFNPYPYLLNSDLLVSLSSTEACPMIFNEAKVLQVPVLTTDFGSAYEFINEGINGEIKPIEEISFTLYKLITDTKYYNSLLDGMRMSEFTSANTYEALYELLD